MAESMYHKYDNNTMDYRGEADTVLAFVQGWVKEATGEQIIEMYNGAYKSKICKGIIISLPDKSNHEIRFLLSNQYCCNECGHEYWGMSDDEDGSPCPECDAEERDHEFLACRLEVTINNKTYYPRDDEDMKLIVLQALATA